MSQSVKDFVVNSNSTSRHRVIFAVIVAVSVVAIVGRIYYADHAGSSYILQVIAKTRALAGFGNFSTLNKINKISKFFSVNWFYIFSQNVIISFVCRD